MLAARLVAVVLFALLGASGDPARLVVTAHVGLDETSLHTETATLRCDGRRARGTGYLAAPARAEQACRAVREGRVTRVAEVQASRRVCGMIYGGPQTARIAGSIAGGRVNLTVTRTDTCGISDWRRLERLLGDPERTTSALGQ